jgi:hypothetical protein
MRSRWLWRVRHGLGDRRGNESSMVLPLIGLGSPQADRLMQVPVVGSGCACRWHHGVRLKWGLAPDPKYSSFAETPYINREPASLSGPLQPRA